MKISGFLALLGASFALGKVDLSSVKRVTNLGTVPNKFIVEVEAAANIPNRRDGTPHERLYNFLRARKIGFNVHKEYDSPGLFVGAALELTTAKLLANILGTAGVIAIHPIKTYSRPNTSADSFTCPVLSKPVHVGDEGLPDSQSTHVQTGVDKLHAKEPLERALDTGIDYKHPDLEAGFGKGFKVAGGPSGGFDLVGDDYNGFNEPVPDNDPLDQCAGWIGTHVAGIIGANPPAGNALNISGVAYGSTILAYRIFGCFGQVSDDVIIDALLRAVKAGADILNLSLGGPNGWTEGAGSVVASRIAATGKIGASGSWFSASPGKGINNFPLPVTEALPIYATSKDTTIVDDACNPLSASTPDLSKFVVLVRRGTCAFNLKFAQPASNSETQRLQLQPNKTPLKSETSFSAMGNPTGISRRLAVDLALMDDSGAGVAYGVSAKTTTLEKVNRINDVIAGRGTFGRTRTEHYIAGTNAEERGDARARESRDSNHGLGRWDTQAAGTRTTDCRDDAKTQGTHWKRGLEPADHMRGDPVLRLPTFRRSELRWLCNGNGFAGITVGDFPAFAIQAADGVFLAEQFAA
ncbi:peptidase S8/S53 domain-containing protein [Mycena rebaudengoi]|nr:peptidase S8/S53 domain-containing protein [Mycena rebaudengoi]